MEEARQGLDEEWLQEIKADKVKEIASLVRKALEQEDEGRGFTIRLPIPPGHPVFADARERMVKIWREVCLKVAEEEGFSVDAPTTGEISSANYVAWFH